MSLEEQDSERKPKDVTNRSQSSPSSEKQGEKTVILASSSPSSQRPSQLVLSTPETGAKQRVWVSGAPVSIFRVAKCKL